MNVLSKIIDALIGFAIGDAMGVPIEFEKRIFLVDHLVTKMIGYGSHDVPKGTFSDDTSMTLATMDSIIHKKVIDYNDMMDRFCDWVNKAKYTATNEVFDIGIATKKALIRYWETKNALISGGKSINENGNGSLMRMLPIAFYCFSKKLNDQEIYNIVKDCSSITHAHEISVLGCYIYVQFIKFLLLGLNKDKSYLKICELNYNNFEETTFLIYERILSGKIKDIHVNDIKSTGYVVDTLEACIWVSLNSSSFDESIIAAINLGDDTDTIGAITGSISGIIYGMENINKEWLMDLARKDYLIEMALQFESILKEIV